MFKNEIHIIIEKKNKQNNKGNRKQAVAAPGISKSNRNFKQRLNSGSDEKRVRVGWGEGGEGVFPD
jgi:hypothetical protein